MCLIINQSNLYVPNYQKWSKYYDEIVENDTHKHVYGKQFIPWKQRPVMFR